MSISLNYFRVFYLVAETGSVSKAAEKLFLSQPTVSNELKKLEAVLGYKLFYRKSRRVELTADGRYLFDMIAEPVRQLIEAEDKAFARQDEGNIFVGFNNGAAEILLSIISEEYVRLNPNASFITSQTTGNTVFSALDKGIIDCALDLRPLAGISDNASHIETVRVQSFNDAIIVGKKHKDLAEKTVDIKMLRDFCLLFLQNLKIDPENNLMKKYKSDFGQTDEKFRSNIAIGDAFSLANLVMAGIGIGVLPDRIADHLIELNPNKLFRVSVSEPLGSYELILNYSNNRKPSQQAMRFIDYLREK